MNLIFRQWVVSFCKPSRKAIVRSVSPQNDS